MSYEREELTPPQARQAEYVLARRAAHGCDYLADLHAQIFDVLKKLESWPDELPSRIANHCESVIAEQYRIIDSLCAEYGVNTKRGR